MSKTIAVAVIALIAFGAVYVFVADNGANNPLTYTNELNITVESTHIIYGADYTLYVDGKIVQTWTMKPGQAWTGTYTYNTPKTQGSKHITITVISTGGGLETQTDSQTIIVGANQLTYNITLKA